MRPQAIRVLNMLREAGEEGCRNGDFMEARIGRFGQRIAELRAAGIGVETRHLSGSAFVYVLTDEPDDLEVSDGGEKDPALPPASTPVAPVADPEAEPISLFDASDMELRRVGLFDLDQEEAA